MSMTYHIRFLPSDLNRNALPDGESPPNLEISSLLGRGHRFMPAANGRLFSVVFTAPAFHAPLLSDQGEVKSSK